MDNAHAKLTKHKVYNGVSSELFYLDNQRSAIYAYECGGRGGGLVDRAADSGLYNPSSIPLGEKKEK